MILALRLMCLFVLHLSLSRLCPNVFKELFDKIQVIKVLPDSTSSLESIVGCVQDKRMIKRILLIIIERSKLAKIGELRRDVLLHGSPSIGKTSLMLATTSKPSGPSIYLVSNVAINDQYHNIGGNNIATLYAIATHNGLAIIFIDEIEALCDKRTTLLSALVMAMNNSPSDLVTIEASNLLEHADNPFEVD